MSRRSHVIAAVAVALAMPGIARADTERAGDVAAALRSDPVYVAPARAARLDTAAAGRIRLTILRKDIGRVHIAVVPGSWAAEAGGVRALANAVDRELRGRGALLIVADGNAFVVTSHKHATAAATAVQRAYDRGGSLEAKLRHSVSGLADVDPGPSGDVGDRNDDLGVAEPEIQRTPDANRISKDVNDTIRFTVVAIVLALLAPFVVGGLWLWLRGRRRREAAAEDLSDALAAANNERAKLGDDIVDLDAPTSTPSVAPEVRAAYERALDAYERSELALKNADNPRRLEAVAAMIAAGRRDAATARQGASAGGANPL